jgi:hypothetical protein
MNWLGLSKAAFLAAILGAILGGAGYAVALARGWDAPYLVGILTGFGVMIGSPDRSGLRGLLVATVAIWIAAIVQTRVGPFASAGIFGFHTTLTPVRALSFAMCGVVAFVLARTSIRRNAPDRAAGA